MNRQRRRVLYNVLDSLDKLRGKISKEEALAILTNAQENVETCMDDEQCALDSRPESLAWSTVSCDMEENVSDLSDASGDLEVAVETCTENQAFSYDDVKEEVLNVVRTLNQVIDR